MLYSIYDLHNVKYIGARVLTNTPACGAFRGHGTVNVRFAFESHLDKMAEKLGLDAVRGAPGQSHRQDPLHHRQRPDRHQLRPARMPRLGRAGERLEGTEGQARPHQGRQAEGPGHGLLALHQRRLQAGQLDRRAARDGASEARLRRLDRRALGRGRDRPGLVDHHRAMRRRRARPRSRPHPHRHRRQRGRAQGQRLLLVARHLHGRQRHHRRRREPQEDPGRRRRAQARGTARGHRGAWARSIAPPARTRA